MSINWERIDSIDEALNTWVHLHRSWSNNRWRKQAKTRNFHCSYWQHPSIVRRHCISRIFSTVPFNLATNVRLYVPSEGQVSVLLGISISTLRGHSLEGEDVTLNVALLICVIQETIRVGWIHIFVET